MVEKFFPDGKFPVRELFKLPGQIKFDMQFCCAFVFTVISPITARKQKADIVLSIPYSGF